MKTRLKFHLGGCTRQGHEEEQEDGGCRGNGISYLSQKEDRQPLANQMALSFLLFVCVFVFLMEERGGKEDPKGREGVLAAWMQGTDWYFLYFCRKSCNAFVYR